MSSYITRWCFTHGEWDQDVDRPYEECPDCEAIGDTPSQKVKALKDAARDVLDCSGSWLKEEQYLKALTRLAECLKALD